MPHRRSATLVLLALLTSCQAQTTDPPGFRFSDHLGVNAQFLWFQNCPQNPALSAETRVEDQMILLKGLGLHHFRMDLHWDVLEPTPGREDILTGCLDPVMAKASRHGLTPLLFLTGSAPFASSAPPGSPFPDQFPPRDAAQYSRFLRKLALRYPEVGVWQVWNEPNLPSSWSTETAGLVEGYTTLLQTSIRELRDLDAQVIPAGFAYWSELPDGTFLLEHLQKAGALDGVSTVAYHPYTFEPEGKTAYSNDPAFFFNRSSLVNGALKKANKKVWATEFGWSTYGGPVEEQPLISPEEQADFLLKRLVLSSLVGFDRIYLFTLTDLDERATPRDRFYGLVDVQGKPKPSYTALKRFLDTLPGNLQNIPPVLKTTGEVRQRSWKRADGATVTAVWGDKQEVVVKGKGMVIDPVQGTARPLQGTLQVTPGLQLVVQGP